MTRHLPLVLLLAACSDGGVDAKFQVRESVEQLHVTHATPGAQLEVVDARGAVVTSGTVDERGALMFRRIAPGQGYRVRVVGSTPPERTQPLKVMSVAESAPDPNSYAEQVLQPGFNYLRMRDGTTLSAYVTLPGPITGTYPTVVNYSGYSPSKPGKPIAGFDFLCADFPIVCTPPDDGTALLAGMFGFATVSVNIRGTGCSGGAYDYFETLQELDGYDVIEIAAAQKWVRHHQVGMVGLSYPGITQLFVAAQQPPSLAAIAPMSVIGNTASTLLPGGILNDGFALSWVTNVLNKAVPYGQGWEQGRADAGDEICRENQLLHGQLVDNVAQARASKFYDPAQHDRYNPTLFADKIRVPVFLTGAWQDEQTGPYFFTLIDRFTQSPSVKVTTFNGVHIDGVAPEVLVDWQAFLELYVAGRVPPDPTRFRNFSTFIFDNVFGSMTALPAARFSSYATLDEARSAWNAEPRIRNLYEMGAGMASDLGAPVSAFVHKFTQYPPTETRPQRLYLQPGGALGAAAPTVKPSASAWRLDPDQGARGVLAPRGDVWAKLPAYDWKQPPAGDAVVFVGEPLATDLELYGTASADLWLISDVDDADVQVTLSEVRPDGKEMYLQSGWLRASYRAPGPHATELWPDQTFEEKDWKPLVPGEWTQVRVATAGFSHVLRAGSRLKLQVDTPGGTRAEWRFALKTFPSAVRHGLGHDADHPSSLVLPRIEGGSAGAPLSPCPSLRGQPCRAYVPYVNAPRP